jgi:glycosyltransferase involved in cell wall biosynthesis
MTTAPVSVVIPCFRCSDTLERAVLSVVSQTLRPVEVLLIDDASGDETLTTARGLSAQYDEGWIRVISLSSNGGPSGARNIGWDHARGTYIAFLDADDSWHPRKLEIQYAWMEAHPQVALTGHPCVFLRPGSPIPALAENWRARPVRATGMFLSNRFLTPSVMLTRSIPYRFDTSQRYCEDYLLWLQTILRGHLAWRLEIPLAYLHKAPFGAGGLSGRMWAMEKGQLTTYRSLHRQGLLSFQTVVGLTGYSLAKYLTRLVRAKRYRT